MRITYACPACDATVMHDGAESARTLVCPQCQAAIDVPADAIGQIDGSGTLLTAAGSGVGIAGTTRVVCGSGGQFSVRRRPSV